MSASFPLVPPSSGEGNGEHPATDKLKPERKLTDHPTLIPSAGTPEVSRVAGQQMLSPVEDGDETNQLEGIASSSSVEPTKTLADSKAEFRLQDEELKSEQPKVIEPIGMIGPAESRMKRIQKSIVVALIPLKIAMFMWWGANAALFAYMSIHMKSLGLTVWQVGVVHTFLPLPQILGQMGLGYLADRYQRHRSILIVSLFCSAALATAIFYVPETRHSFSPLPAEQDGVEPGSDQSGGPLEAPTEDVVVVSHTFALYLSLRLVYELMCATNYVLLESVAVVLSDQHPGATYGHQRLWASVSAGIVPLLAGVMMDSVLVAEELPRDGDSAGPPVEIRLRPADFGVLFYLFDALVLLTIVVTWFKINPDMSSSASSTAATTGSINNKPPASSSPSSPRKKPITYDPVDVLVITDAVEEEDSKLLQEIQPLPSSHNPGSPGDTGPPVTTIISTPSLPPGNPKSTLKDLGRILLEPEAFAFALTLLVLGVLWGVTKIFVPWRISELGGNRFLVGLGLTLSTLLGVPIIVFAGTLMSRVGHLNLLAMTFGVYALRFGAYALLRQPEYFLIFETLEGITYHLMWVVAVTYAALLTPLSLVATVQGFAASLHYCIGIGLSGLIGGWGFDHYDAERTFFGFCVVSLVFGLLLSLFTGFRRVYRSKKPKKECPQNEVDTKKFDEESSSSRGHQA